MMLFSEWREFKYEKSTRHRVKQIPVVFKDNGDDFLLCDFSAFDIESLVCGVTH